MNNIESLKPKSGLEFNQERTLSRNEYTGHTLLEKLKNLAGNNRTIRLIDQSVSSTNGTVHGSILQGEVLGSIDLGKPIVLNENGNKMETANLLAVSENEIGVMYIQTSTGVYKVEYVPKQ